MRTNQTLPCFSVRYTTFIKVLIVFTPADVSQLFDTTPHQKDRVETWLSLPLSELLLRRFQHSCVLTGSLG